MLLLVCSRLLIHLLLYRAGFVTFTADAFGRMMVAARWAQQPFVVSDGAWLPLHTYLFGTALRLWWDVVLVPRGLAIVFGCGAIITIYWLSVRLFNHATAVLSALLLSINPAHIRLSAAPLPEGVCILLLLMR